MDFQDLNLSYQYRSDHESGNIVEDFYIPVLSRTKIYKRAVGYFTSKSLMHVAKGLAELISRGGTMQLIASPQLNENDIEAINEGYRAREEVIEEVLLRSFDTPENSLLVDRLNYLAWLIASEQLDIKIAVLKNNSVGIYHEKIGIMEDWNGNKIAFSGSSNETEGGLYNNFECNDVFCSWHPSEEMRVSQKEMDFDRLWANKTNNIDIFDFPNAVKEKILRYKRNNIKKIDPELSSSKVDIRMVRESSEQYFPKIPSGFIIREYQQEAIRKWFKNECQGLLEMATGTGKTITALSAISKLGEVTQRLGVVIICPYTHLVDQWVKDIIQFNMFPIIAYNSRSLWEDDLKDTITAFRTFALNHFCVITTNATFTLPHMQSCLARLVGPIVIVADEAHHLGAENSRKCLPENIPYRLALSATPNRWYDEEGTDGLLKYFGGQIVFQFGLKEAIGEFLTNYHYYPHLIYLDEDESEQYYDITRKIVKLFPKDGDLTGDGNQSLQSLFIERARVLGRARNKITKLKELMRDKNDSKYNIVYCGDSSVDGERQIDAVIKMLGNELDMKVHSFTAREDEKQRKQLLNRFEEGELQALVAIKCLDEGVDVPATQTAYILASSTNPREFIQRRGRVLRKHPKKTYSYIHDFIVIPRHLKEIQLIEPSLFNMERKIVKRELTRFVEFADLAINGPLAHEKLEELKKAYNLLNY